LETSGERAVLIVDDGSPGPPSSTIRTARSRESGGTGLGMSIMADIVTTLNGTMTLHQSPLGGLRLHFDFPTAVAPADAQSEVLT